MTEQRAPVVIAGGGPTGLLLASELALAGIRPIVLDKREAIEEFSAGMAIHGRSLDLLRLRGLADRIAPEEIFTWPRTPFGFLWLDLAEVDEREYTHAYPQWRAERLLERRAIELGVEPRRGHEVTGFTQDDDGVVVEVRSADGPYRIAADYLVGSDGADSTVRRAAASLHRRRQEVLRRAGGRRTGRGRPRPVRERPARGRVFGALPLRPGMTRLMTIEFGKEPEPDAGPVTTEELLASVRRVRGRDVGIVTTHFSYRYGGRTSLADHYRAGRVFLAGEAAHQLFVSGTQGLNTGLHDAFNLGWKLAAELNGHAPPGCWTRTTPSGTRSANASPATPGRRWP
ncbi:FAD-dependent monooxygenase [Streptomyces sp. M19]